MAIPSIYHNEFISVSGAPVKHFIQGQFSIQKEDGTTKNYTITPILLRDRKAATEFLKNYCDEFYRNGKPYPEDKVTARVDTLIQRFMKDEAWSSWLVHDDIGQIAAWWTIGYDETPGNLQAALMVKKDYQNQKIATGIWKFTTEYLFRVLKEQGASVKKEHDLSKVNLYALSHPDNTIMNDIYQKLGFECEGSEYVKSFENLNSDGSVLHDGTRNRWRISLAEFL